MLVQADCDPVKQLHAPSHEDWTGNPANSEAVDLDELVELHRLATHENHWASAYWVMSSTTSRDAGAGSAETHSLSSGM